MTFVSRTLRLTDLTLTVIGVLFGIVTLWMWLDAVIWPTPYAYAHAFAWTLVTLVVIAAGAIVERLHEWSE